MIEKDTASKASGKHCFTLLTVPGLDGKGADTMLWDSTKYETENRQWFKRQDKLRWTKWRWLKLNFLENPCHARVVDAVRGLVSRGVKGNSWACSKRLTWRDKKRYDYCILHGTSLRTASPVVWDASGNKLHFLCGLETVLNLGKTLL